MKSFQARQLSLTFLIPLMLVELLTIGPVTAQSSRQCVCHVENKDTGEGHVIQVDQDSLEGHLRHGDVQCSVDCGEIINKTCNISTGGKCGRGTD